MVVAPPLEDARQPGPDFRQIPIPARRDSLQLALEFLELGVQFLCPTRRITRGQGDWLGLTLYETFIRYFPPACAGAPQGNRASNVGKTSEKSLKRGFVPTADFAFASDASFYRSVLL